jgi:hypothetical protein
VTVLEESKTGRGRRNEAQGFNYPTKSIPQAQCGEAAEVGGINYYTVHIGKHPRSEAGLSKKKKKKKSKEIRICKYSGTVDSQGHSSQRREGDVKDCVL